MDHNEPNRRRRIPGGALLRGALSAIVRLGKNGDGRHTIEVHGTPEVTHDFNAGNVITAFRAFLGGHPEVRPDQTRTLTFGDTVQLFTDVTGIELSDDIDNWDPSFTTTIGTIHAAFRTALGITHDRPIDPTIPVTAHQLLATFGIVINADITLVLDDDTHICIHIDAHHADEETEVAVMSDQPNNADTQDRETIARQAIEDLLWNLELADNPKGNDIAPLWALSDKYDIHRPTTADLTDRPWDNDTAFQDLMGDLDAHGDDDVDP